MTHEQNSAAAIADLADPAHALVDEYRVARGQRLVDNENVRVNTHCGCKGQSRLHAARIRAERLVDDVSEFAEVNDPIETLVDLSTGHPQDRAAHVNVLAAGV